MPLPLEWYSHRAYWGETGLSGVKCSTRPQPTWDFGVLPLLKVFLVQKLFARVLLSGLFLISAWTDSFWASGSQPRTSWRSCLAKNPDESISTFTSRHMSHLLLNRFQPLVKLIDREHEIIDLSLKLGKAIVVAFGLQDGLLIACVSEIRIHQVVTYHSFTSLLACGWIFCY